jgi:hypothetical protein
VIQIQAFACNVSSPTAMLTAAAQAPFQITEQLVWA